MGFSLIPPQIISSVIPSSRTLSHSVNSSLLFDPEEPKMRFVVRDPIDNRWVKWSNNSIENSLIDYYATIPSCCVLQIYISSSVFSAQRLVISELYFFSLQGVFNTGGFRNLSTHCISTIERWSLFIARWLERCAPYVWPNGCSWNFTLRRYASYR